MIVRTITTSAVVVAVSLALSGCSSDDPEPDAPTTPPAPIVTEAPEPDASPTDPDPATTEPPAPSPTPDASEMTIEEAAEHYLDLVSSVNALRTDPPEIETWEDDVRFAGDFVTTMQTFKDELASAQWPQEIQPHIDDVIVDVTSETAYVQVIADAESEDAWTAARDQPLPARSNASEVLRTQLGLEEAGGNQ